MLRIHIICLGKLKEKHWRWALAEYLKRLSAFAKIDITELREESFGENDNPTVIKKKEAKKIFTAIQKYTDAPLIVLDEQGESMTSPDLAATLSKLRASEWVFIIGGPLGLHPDILAKAQLVLSLSRLTFTHQMARVLLTEQIYRALMINSGRKYHY